MLCWDGVLAQDKSRSIQLMTHTIPKTNGRKLTFCNCLQTPCITLSITSSTTAFCSCNSTSIFFSATPQNVSTLATICEQLLKYASRLT